MSYSPQVRNTIDEVNSSIVPLLAGQTFTGGWTDITLWNGISVFLDGKSLSTAPGTLQMQFSQDCITVNESIQINIQDIDTANSRTLAPISRYFRVVYTNGGVDQTVFNLQTIYHTSQVSSVSRLNQDLVGNEDVINVRSVSTGQQPDGDFVNAKADGTAFVSVVPLGVGGVYDSGWVDTDGFVSVELFIATDQVSSSQGIQILFTDDVQGAATVRAIETYTYSQDEVDRGFLSINFGTRLDGFRVIYTNNSVAQTSFFLECDLRTNTIPFRTSNIGAIVTTDFQVEVALGNIPGYSNGTKFGSIRLIDAADAQPLTIWRLADDGRTPLRVARKTFQTVASNAWVASNNALDAGKQITVELNDSNNNFVTHTLTLNGGDGRIPVSTGISALDCNVAFLSGDTQTLSGDVYVTNANNFTNGVPNLGSAVLAFISQADGRTQQSVYRVPSGYTMIIRNVYSTITAGTSNGSVQVTLRIKPDGGSWYVVRPYAITTAVALDREEIITLSENSLVEFTISSVGGNDTNTLAFFNYELIAN